ncbi:hypothetical protein ACLBWZ_16465 [Brucellaceae bacterium C25G]
MIWQLVPTWLKLTLAAIVAAFLLAVGFYKFGQYKERQRFAVLQLQNDLKTERERVKDDAHARSLSDYDFCLHALHRRGVRSQPECEQLRGLATE